MPRMRNGAYTVGVRLVATVALLLLGAALACRPAWSPDGNRILFACRQGNDRFAVAVYDRTTERVELVHPAAGASFAARRMSVPLWSPDGRQMLFLGSDSSRKRMRLVLQDVADRKATRVLDVDADIVEATMLPPVVRGHELFLAAPAITCLDLERGVIRKRRELAPGEQFLVVPAGDGIGYAKAVKGDEKRIEIGTVDPDSLELHAIVTTGPEMGWKVSAIPAFSPDGERIALPAQSDAGAAILVFRDGKLESTLPIEGATRPRLGCLAWAPNGATLYATVVLGTADRDPSLALVETMVGGSVTRLSPILSLEPSRKDLDAVPLMFQLALSPDGKTVALSTTMLDSVPPESQGLYLVDLTSKERTKKRVPFPELPPAGVVHLVGSDAMLELGTTLAQAFGAANPAIEMTVTGGGTARAFSELVGGEAVLGMATRPAKDAELAMAKQAGRALVPHPVAIEAFAVCVHPDNPLTTISRGQLAAVFGSKGPGEWRDLAADFVPPHAAVRAVGADVASAGAETFRALVLGGALPGTHFEAMGSKERVRFVADHVDAITYVDLGFVDAGVKVVPVATEPGAAAVAPTTAAIRDGSYCLQRPLLLYSAGDPPPAVAQFLAWLATDAAREALTKAGYMPAR